MLIDHLSSSLTISPVTTWTSFDLDFASVGVIWRRVGHFNETYRRRLENESFTRSDSLGPVKNPSPARPGLKLKTNDVSRSETVRRPKNRIAHQVETTLERQKAIDHHWGDLVDNPSIVPYPSKLLKFITPLEAPAWPTPITDMTILQ